MSPHRSPPHDLTRFRDLVGRILASERPGGAELDTCRAAFNAAINAGENEVAYQALCMLLEGALADPALSIDDTQILVPLLRALARGTVEPGELI
jgi:hypothetical protein